MRYFLTLLILTVSAFAESYKVETIDFPHYVAPEVGGLGFTPEGDIVVALRRHGVLMGKPRKIQRSFSGAYLLKIFCITLVVWRLSVKTKLSFRKWLS